MLDTLAMIAVYIFLFVWTTMMTYFLIKIGYELYTSTFGHIYYANMQTGNGSNITVTFAKKGLGRMTIKEVNALLDYVPKKYGVTDGAMLVNLTKLDRVYTPRYSNDITWVLYNTKDKLLFYDFSKIFKKIRFKKKSKIKEEVKPVYKGPKLLKVKE